MCYTYTLKYGTGFILRAFVVGKASIFFAQRPLSFLVPFKLKARSHYYMTSLTITKLFLFKQRTAFYALVSLNGPLRLIKTMAKTHFDYIQNEPSL